MRIYVGAGRDRGQPLEETTGLKVGHEYPVLALLASALGDHVMPTSLLILDSAHRTTWWPSDMFVTETSNIPSNWIVQIDERGDVHIAPAAWLREGFWEDKYANEPSAVADFEAELKTILDED